MGRQFFKTFEKVNKKQWIEKATKDLKGENPFEKFNWEIEPGIKVGPYFDLDDLKESIHPFQNRLLETNHPSGDLRHWDNLEVVVVDNELKANQKALTALEGGAEGVVFDIQHVDTLSFDKLLNEIQLNYCAIWFKIDSSQKALAESLADYFSDKHLKGGFFTDDDKMYPKLSEIFRHKASITITIAHEGEAVFTDKISDLLFRTNNLAEQLINSKFTADQFFSQHGVVFPLGPDFFGEIAALRALRQLHFQIARAYGAKTFNPEDLHICSISKVWANETYNPNANMLKGTTAAMAAILGGCNSLIVEPEDKNNVTMTRVARNVSHVLKEEAYLSSSVDPAAGSYYIESLTENLAQIAWNKFQQKNNQV